MSSAIGASSGPFVVEILQFVGQRRQSITADTYTHVVSDGEEVGYAALV